MKEISEDNLEKTGLNGHVHDAIAIDDILDIHIYLIKKNGSITKCLGLLKSAFLLD